MAKKAARCSVHITILPEIFTNNIRIRAILIIPDAWIKVGIHNIYNQICNYKKDCIEENGTHNNRIVPVGNTGNKIFAHAGDTKG